MSDYNEQILLQGAQEFNLQAGMIVWSCAIRYVLIALLFAIPAVVILANTYLRDTPPLGIYGLLASAALIGAASGIWRGRVLAFRLRLEAQRLMALVQLERNTRCPKIGQ